MKGEWGTFPPSFPLPLLFSLPFHSFACLIFDKTRHRRIKSLVFNLIKDKGFSSKTLLGPRVAFGRKKGAPARDFAFTPKSTENSITFN